MSRMASSGVAVRGTVQNMVSLGSPDVDLMKRVAATGLPAMPASLRM